MKKRSTLWIVATILLGGVIMLFSLNHHTEQEKLQAQIQREQKRMALHAINRFEGIKKIEFTSFEENKMTGVWSAGATLNDEYDGIFQLWGFDGEIYLNEGPSEKTGRYLILKEVETDITDISGVEVIYWNKNS